MIAWIVRRLPQRIRFEIVRQFLDAVVLFSPRSGMATVRECQEIIDFRGQMEGWLR